MAIPYFVSYSTAEGTGAVDPGLPADIITNDILILTIEGEGEDGNADGAPPTGGWAPIDGATGSIASATDGAADRTRNTCYWTRYNSALPPSTAVPDAGNHTLAVISAWRGCIRDVSPIHKTQSSSSGTNNTGVSITGVTVNIHNCLVVYISTAGDNITFSGWANANLADPAITELVDVQTSQGSDGSIGIAAGALVGVGDTGTTTATVSASEEEANWCIALIAAGGSVERTGSVGYNESTANSGNFDITIPADCTLLIIGVSGYEDESDYFDNGDAEDANSTTLSCESVPLKVGKVMDDSAATQMCGLWYLANPGTGALQTMAWDWPGTSTANEGVVIFYAFYKGGDTTTPIRARGGAIVTNTGTPASTGLLDGESGDMVVAVCNEYGAGLDIIWTGATMVVQREYNSDSEEYAEAALSGDVTVTEDGDASYKAIAGLVLKVGAGGTVYTVACADSIALDDIPRVTAQFAAIAADGIAISAGDRGQAVFLADGSDSIALNDIAAMIQAMFGISADSVTVNDTTEAIKSLVVAAADSIGLDDTAGALAALIAAAADSIALDDISAETRALLVAAADGIALSDVADGTLEGILEGLALDGITVSDTTIAIATFMAAAADGVSLSDLALGAIAGILEALAVDGVALSDGATGAAGFQVAGADSITLGDTTLGLFILTAMAADGITVHDAVTVQISLGAQAADGINLTDRAAGLAAFLVAALDGVALSDVSIGYTGQATGILSVTLSTLKGTVTFTVKKPTAGIVAKRPDVSLS